MAVVRTDFSVLFEETEGVLQYPFSFPAISVDSIKAYDVNPALSAGDPAYRTPVSGATVTPGIGGIAAGGFVTLQTPLAAGRHLEIIRETERTQHLVLNNQARIPPAAITGAFDKLTMIVQEAAVDGGADGTDFINTRIDEIETDVAGVRGDVAALRTDMNATQDEISDLQTGLSGKVDNTDPRLSDARTPTTHAATHGGGGSDPLPLASASTPGLARPDGTTIVASNGVLTAVGGGGTGTSDHRALTNRDDAGQHPTSAISHGDEALDGIIDDLESNAAAIEGWTVAASPPLTGGGGLSADVTIGIQDATTSQKGAVMLSSSTSSTSSALAATPAAVKAAYDLASKALIVGEFRMMPFSSAELPEGWYLPTGDYVALTSAIGAVLNSFSSTYKTNWGITTSGSSIRLYDPNKFIVGAKGRFPRFTFWTPGETYNDAIRNITASLHHNWVNGPGFFQSFLGAFFSDNLNSLYINQLPGTNTNILDYSTYIKFDASRVVPVADENRPYAVALTPAFYLGV